MSAEQPNCFTIFQVKSRIDGVPIDRNILLSHFNGNLGVHLGEGCPIVWLEAAPQVPTCTGRFLNRAKIVGREKPRFAKADERTKSIIVAIYCQGLYFDIQPLAEGLNLWPGGDGYIRPFAQFGEHKNGFDKKQLFEIPDGRFMYVIDQKKAVARLSCVDGQPVISIPDMPELVEFLCSRAKAQRKVQALDWVLHNLRALLKENADAEYIRNSIAELSRLRENA